MTKILVTMKVDEMHIDQLLKCAPECEWTFVRHPSDEQILDADIVVGNVPVETLGMSEKLRLVQLQSAGVGGYGALCRSGKVRVCNASGAYGRAISEHMFGILLGLQKRLFSYRDQQFSGAWNSLGEVKSVAGSKVLVIGMGDIGGEFARRCHAFGATVRGVRRSTGTCPDYCEAVGTAECADTWLGDADIVFLCMPETRDTVGFMSRERIRAMKKGAILLNAGRGTAIDTEALIEALNDGHLFGAGLDVTDPEPLPEDHPLWKCKNAMITPHVSGGFHLKYTHDSIVGIACRNIRALLDGDALTNEVDYERGY